MKLIIAQALSRGGVAHSSKREDLDVVVQSSFGAHVDGNQGRACAVTQTSRFSCPLHWRYCRQLCLIGEVIATHAAPLCLLVFESGL
jgi:hypothetical protein